MDITTATRLYVQCASNDAITEPTGGTWMSAYALYLGATEPINGSWLQTVCIELGITEPINNSWIIALANYYNISAPVNGTWMNAIQDEVCNGVPTILIWNLVTTLWNLETSQWATLNAPTAPTFDQEGDLLSDSTPTLTGTSDANNNIILIINSITYTSVADGLGIWSIDVTDELPGSPAGTNYSVDITAKDMTNGLETTTVGSVNVLLTTKTLTFELRTQWSLYWYYAGMQVEKELTPGMWSPVEYEGNPTWNNGSTLYKVQPLVGPGVSTGYQTENVMSFRPNDDSGAGQNDPVFRDIILDLGYNYRIVGVNLNTPNSPTNYGRFNLYTVKDGATVLLPQYDGEDSDWLTGNVQQTFTL